MSEGIEKFKVYKLSERLEIFIHKVTATFPADEKYRSVDQLRRSSSSTTNNISEGYHRYSYGDKIHKMRIARGEAGETRDGIVKAHKKGFTSKKIADFTHEKYTELIKGINGYIRYLSDEQIKKMDQSKNIKKN
ncbi:four helix bundle protein [Candidatus Parcubacteria bacterium]|nr:four helix bundle protein [Candidatus Parcubacteria bacterium]MCG2700742.1 four helix bundle protein [Candidatus Parcubacteria bacterium]